MTDRTCPSCGKRLTAGAPLGLCAECLIKAGFDTAVPPASGTGRGSAFVPPAIDELRPLFPQLELLEVIGRGGMGAVYKARQPGLDRLVALKVLPAAFVHDPGFADRFIREARALARLQHPRIVTVHDFGITGGLHYLLMEYVDGPNLRQVQRSGGLRPAQALRIVPEICEALQFAHDRGIVHRDIKPENLLLDRDGHVKITDFGIAKLVGPAAETTTSLTGDVHVIGTPHYMAPEQIERPADVDHRADIYSLGVVFYELLTGELPLGRFAPPSNRVQLDVRLDEVVLRTLEKEPGRRYQQASEVKTHLDTIAGSPAQPGAPGRSRRRTVNPLPAMVLYGLQTLFLVIGASLLWHLQPALVLDGGWAGGFEPWGPATLGGAPFRWLGWHVLTLIAAYVAWGMLHHASWTALPARFRGTTPGKAVGLLFVPVFNFYWVFVSLGRLAEGYNAAGEARPALAIRDASGLALAKAFSFVAVWTIGWFPPFTSIVCIADAILFVLYYRAVAFNANRVLAGRTGAPTAAAA